MTSKNDAQFLMAYLHSKDYADRLETLTQQKMLENIVVRMVEHYRDSIE